MLWVKTGTHIIDHERLLAAGAIARDLYQWGMLYAGKHETDGELPMVAVLASPWGAGGKANIKPALKLVEVGLWLRTTHGFSVCRWAEQGNQTKAQLKDDRASARIRMEKRRPSTPPPSDVQCSPEQSPNEQRTSVDVPTSTSNSLSESDLGSEIALPPDEEPTGVRPSKYRYRDAYCAGIAKGKGGPYSYPAGKSEQYADEDLGRAISTFAHSRSSGKALRGDALIGWIDAAAEDFAAAVAEGARAGVDDPKYWSNYAPKGLIRFLNQASTAEEARNVG